MSQGPKVPPEQAWKAIHAMASQEEMDRIKALSDEEVEKELAAAGFDLEEVRSAGKEVIEKVAREAGIGGVETSAGSRSRSGSGSRSPSHRRVWFVVGIAAAAALIAAALASPRMVAFFKRDDIRPDEYDAMPRRELTREEQAQQLRGRAFEECQARKWDACTGLLDEAKKLDPAGETNAFVQSLRLAAQSAEGADAGTVPRNFETK